MNSVAKAETLTDNEATYRIGDLSKEFDVTLRTLRFYEDKGLLSPRRVGNTRLYSRADRGRLKLILLCKRVGLSLLDAKEILELYEPEGDNRRQLELAIVKGEEQMRFLEKERRNIDAAMVELDDTLRSVRATIARLDG